MPSWCPKHLAFAGRAPFDTDVDRAQRAAWQVAVPWHVAAVFWNTYDVQETHKRRQRAIAASLHAFLTQSARQPPEASDADGWAVALQGWVAWHLAERAGVLSKPIMAGTVSHWVGCALGIIPAHLTKRATKRLFDGIAAFRPSRSVALPRGQQDAGDRALGLVASRIGSRLWLAIAIMIRAGQRSPESVRVAAGHVAPGSLVITHSHLRAVPMFEKTNSFGSGSRPPITLPLYPGEAEVIRMRWPSTPLSSKEAKQLRDSVASLLHQAGYTDIRVPRRDLAEAVDCDQSGKLAAAALRHAKGSAHTITYTGGWGTATRMEGILRGATRRGAASPPALARGFPKPDANPLASPSPRPPRALVKERIKHNAPVPLAHLRVPLTMAGGRLPSATVAARKRAMEQTHMSAHESAARRLLGSG